MQHTRHLKTWVHNVGWSFAHIFRAVVTGGLSETKLGKGQVGKLFSDVGKVISAVVAQPLNSITGHVYNPKFETGIGKGLAVAIIEPLKLTEIAAKTFADTLSFGLATKAVNLVRVKGNKETVGNYREGVLNSSLPGGLQKGFNIAGQLVGTVASVVLTSGAGAAGAGAAAAEEAVVIGSKVKTGMSIFNSISNFVSSPLGQLTGSLVQTVVQNVTAPKSPQNASFNTGNVSSVANLPLAPAAAAALGATPGQLGQTYQGYMAAQNVGQPWYKNQMTVWIISGTAALFFVLFLMFKRKR